MLTKTVGDRELRDESRSDSGSSGGVENPDISASLSVSLSLGSEKKPWSELLFSLSMLDTMDVSIVTDVSMVVDVLIGVAGDPAELVGGTGVPVPCA